MIEFKEKYPDRDVESLKDYNIENINSISIPIIIKGEPIVLMFLKMFDNQDINNLKLFMNMNLSDGLISYVTTLTLLSLVEFVKNDCVRYEMTDLNLTEHQIVNCFNNSNFGIHVDVNDELYKIFIEDYCDTSDKKHNYYSFLPSMLDISSETINNYFYYIYVIKRNNKKEFIKITKCKRFVFDKKILSFLEKLII